MLDLYKGKKVFITGHTGFKGSWLTEWLLGLGAEVAGYSLYLPSEPCHFSLLDLKKRIVHYENDIGDADAVHHAMSEFAPEIVFHLAAQPIVSASIKDPLKTFHTNIMGTAHILEALRKLTSVKSAVIITSDKCYENVEWEFGYRETDKLGGKDPYSASKAGAEAVFHSYFRTYLAHDSDRIQLATARAGNVIGGGDWALDRIVPDCMRAWGKGAKPFIRNPYATRPWQHVLEPLSGYLALGALLYDKAAGVNGESFNFGPTAEVNNTVGELLNGFQKLWSGMEWETTEDPLAKKECSLLKLNCDKSLNRLNWLPCLNFHETMQFTVDWYRAFYAGEEIRTFTRKQIRGYCELAKQRERSWSR